MIPEPQPDENTAAEIRDVARQSLLSKRLPELAGFLDEIYLRSQASRFGLHRQYWDGILAEIADKYLQEDADANQLHNFLSSLRLEELALARACVLGSDLAWETLLTRYRESLYEAAAAIAKDESRGREIADSLYAELYGMNERGEERKSKLNSYTGIGSLGGWLRTVLAQSYVDRYRYEHRFVEIDEQNDADAASSLTTARNEGEMLAVDPRLERVTDQVIAELNQEDRFILLCYYIDGQSLAEIASTLHVHISTVSRRIEKIAKNIRKKIVRRLVQLGMSHAQAEEALSVDVRDLQVSVRNQLEKTSQQPSSQSFSIQRVNETNATRRA